MLSEKLNRHRTLYFINAYCRNYQTLPPAGDDSPAQIRLQLVAQEFSVSSSGKYIDLWTQKDEQQRMN